MSQNRATMGCSDAIFLGWSTNYSLDVKCALSNGPKTYLWIAHVLKEARGRSSMSLLSGILLVVRSIVVGKDGIIQMGGISKEYIRFLDGPIPRDSRSMIECQKHLKASF